jgi:hypothetical protein
MFFCANAQSSKDKKIEDNNIQFGVRVGSNIANTHAPDGSFVGLNAGVFAAIPLSSSFAIQPELAYSKLGTWYSGFIPVGSGHTSLNYLVVPVLAKYAVSQSGFSVYAGPQYGFLLSAKNKLGNQITDIKDQLKSGELSGIFGAEYFFKIGIGISVCYQLGFSNITTNTTDAVVSAKNKALTFTLAYKF